MTSRPAAPIAVTGATGHVGGLVARDLAATGVEQRLLVRSNDRAPDLPGATVFEAPYDDRTAAVIALTGVRLLLMVSAAESEDRARQHRAFLDAAAEAGVEHVVYTSFLGAAPDATFLLARDHWATEQHIRDTGVHHTFLRNSLYLDVLPELAGPDGVIRGPARDGVVGAVARVDVARVATAVLAEPDRHRDVTYDLTGPEALTLAEVARTVNEVTGSALTYHHETLEEAFDSRADYGAPDWQVAAWVSTYTAIATGELAAVTGHVEAVTGRRPMSLREHLQATHPAARG
ncbi:SDR family oxidoreductase [Actinotalea sp. K2]|uniref:SDR family oxidoreductase n=1 Tax=Actinotalea sp. K2 TaxID=2939438 RepID=UPI00201833C6|nr:SDR family oxidoreductase [Actinotalea sp. K2]MCL3860934.1 SDR family oxidoreductase [Actinotalea sp. K2]